MSLRDELDALPTGELHDRALAVAKRRVDVGFLWRLIEALPVAEAAVGDEQRSKVDVLRPLALINDLFDAGEGELGDALRPMYIDYLEEHGAGEAPRGATNPDTEG
ncbi:MAG: hypothetical protein H0W82_02930 [Actinobacteria bacterium]|nr:hypothetical protein [Actinomycetota bacterium]